MSKSYSVGDLMSMYYENEFLAVKEAALPQFSAKHNRKIKKAFDVFAKNKASRCSQPIATGTKRPLNIKKRILIAAIIIVSLAFITSCVIAFISNSFCGTVYNDNTYLFAFDIGDSPTVIEEEYMLSVVPEGYELYEISSDNINRFVVYKNSNNQELIFEQTVKSEYSCHINTEGFTIEETLINGCDAICVEFVRLQKETQALVVWNSDDYILMLDGNFTKEELADLASSNEIKGF